MAATYTNDKVSNSSSDPQLPTLNKGQDGVALDEKRRVALQEVDTAKFSYVYSWSLLDRSMLDHSVTPWSGPY